MTQMHALALALTGPCRVCLCSASLQQQMHVHTQGSYDIGKLVTAEDAPSYEVCG